MPHPERGMFLYTATKLPLLKQDYQKQNKNIPQEGPGLLFLGTL